MAGSTLIEVTEAVKVQLGTASLLLAFTAVRVPLHKPDIKDATDEMVIRVMPIADRGEIGSRTSTEHEYDVLLGLMQKVTDNTNATIDPLTLFTEQVADVFRMTGLDEGITGRKERWVKQEMQPYSPQHLDEDNVFLGTVKLTFTGTRL